MKKVLSVLMVFLLTLGMVIPTFAADSAQNAIATEASAPLGHSIQSTAPKAGTPTSDVASEIEINTTFSVVFDKNSFVWSATGDSTFNVGKLTADWLRVEGAALGQDFSVEAISVDSANGNAIFTFRALREYKGDVTFYLDSSGVAANAATNAIVRTINVTKPPTGPSYITNTRSGGTAPVCTSHSGDVKIETGEQLHFRVPADNFDWTEGAVKDASKVRDTSWIRLNNATIGKDFEVNFTTPVNSSDVTFSLTALRATTYNGFTISMRGGGGEPTTLSTPINLTVSDVGEGSIITGIAPGSVLGIQNSSATLNGSTITDSQLYNLDIKQGDELLISLPAGFFTWDGTPPYAGSPVTQAQLRRGKIKVGSANRKGGNIIESGYPKFVNINGATYVSLKFNDKITTTNDIDFSVRLYLMLDRTRHYDSSLEIEGVLSPDIFNIAGYDTFFDISDGSVVEADEFIRNVELYLGNGVSVHTNLYKGKRYSGIAVDDISASDEENLNRFPSIERVISIKTSTLNRPNNKVTLDYDGVNYYVYDADGNYVGRSNEKLPYSHKYYLSNKEIDMKDDISIDTDVNGDITEPDGDYIYDPIAGDETPPNYNENPGTGF